MVDREHHIESSPVWDTSFLAELIYDLINRQIICGKCPKWVRVQYLQNVDDNVGLIMEKAYKMSQRLMNCLALACFGCFYTRQA